MTKHVTKALLSLAKEYRVNRLVSHCERFLKEIESRESHCDNLRNVSKVDDGKHPTMGSVLQSSSDNNMYLVNTTRKTCVSGRNSSRITETPQTAQERTDRETSDTCSRDTNEIQPQHIKVEVQEDCFDNTENTSQNLLSENPEVRNYNNDSTSQNVTLEKSYADDASGNSNESQLRPIKTEIIDESFCHTYTVSRNIGVVLENLEDGSYTFPANILPDKNESQTEHIKEEVSEETTEIETPEKRNCTVSNSKEMKTATSQKVPNKTAVDKNDSERNSETVKMEIRGIETDTKNVCQPVDKELVLRVEKVVLLTRLTPDSRETPAATIQTTAPLQSAQEQEEEPRPKRFKESSLNYFPHQENLPCHPLLAACRQTPAATIHNAEEEPRPKRFKVASNEELSELFDARHTKSTKRNTAWGMKIFQDWNIEMFGRPLDMAAVSVTDLAEELRKFYFGARPNKGSDHVYQCNTLINIRAAINRYLSDTHRNIDIVRDKEFKHANGVLDGLLKQRKSTEPRKAITQKTVIEQADLQKFFTYLESAESSPIVLRLCVWFNLSMHFVTRGMEFHQQLTPDSLIFQHDEFGEYVSLAHDTHQKKHQGGLNYKESMNDKRMYSCPESPSCPVKMLRLLLEKTDRNATHLFNQYKKEACFSPTTTKIWYTTKPLATRTFARFLSDMCKGADVDKPYTPHCLRSTAIHHLNDTGFETRHSMYVSDQRKDLSLRLYYPARSSDQSRSQSTALSVMTSSSSQVPLPPELKVVVSKPEQATEST
ncbi:uncharacterized protein LOC110441960 isoform X2 [Mizuhopecten yessoensis]|nr:uncharacterized protein LOC110441960 isoform X2 [Mizuhopecten yessoensis]